MAVRQLVLSKKIEQRKASLAELIEQETALDKREAELEISIEEAQTEEETTAVEAEADQIEADKKELDEKKSKLEGEIAELEKELDQLNAKEPKGNPEGERSHENFNREDGIRMNRYKVFKDMTREAVNTLVEREEVKEFIKRARELYSQSRSATGAELLIPDVLLDMLRNTISETSKLLTRVNFKPVKGKARQNISGTIPEAVWTEMVASLNELEISFNQVEVDGYMVGGFVPVPNSTLEDADAVLLDEILSMIGKAIGKALDKAILYGTGIKQPLGVMTRLGQTVKPGNYPANAPEWNDLHTSHVKKVNTTGIAMIGDIILAAAVCKNDYSIDGKFYAMSETTWAYILTQLLNFTASGALVSGANKQMPVIGGDVIILDFIPDKDIIGGYGDLYLLVEREGTVLASSEHARFLQNQTLYKGLARYDGLPVIAEGFFAINIGNIDVDTTADFETDYANTELGALAVTSVAHASDAGKTTISFTGGEVSGTTFGYKIAGKAVAVNSGDKNTGFTTIASGGSITAATGKIITIVEFDANGRAIKVGSAQVVAHA